MNTPAIGTALRFGTQQLGQRLEAEVLLASVLGQTRSYLWAYPEIPLTAEAWPRYQALVAQAAAGWPLAYLTGVREFWSLELGVTPDTLIPRPDTETLVSAALASLPATPATVADLGTGSGAIALALAHECTQWQVLGVDNSRAALTVAAANARRLGIRNVTWVQADWGQALAQGAYDLVVSNPPYLAATDPHLPSLCHEPQTALVAGPTGLEALAHLVVQGKILLRPGGWLWLEHGYDQGTAVADLLARQGYRDITHHRDLAGWVRVSGGACRG